MGETDQIIVEESTEPPICGLTNATSSPAGPPSQRDPSTLNTRDPSHLTGAGTPSPPSPLQTEKGSSVSIGGTTAATTVGTPPSWNDIAHPHTLPLAELEPAFGTSFGHGLTGAEAAHRLGQDGPNSVKGAKGLSVWEILLRQVSNSLTVVLFIVMALSFAIADFIEGGVIAAVILLNIVVGSVFTLLVLLFLFHQLNNDLR